MLCISCCCQLQQKLHELRKGTVNVHANVAMDMFHGVCKQLRLLVVYCALLSVMC